ncbi:MAG: pyridoxamine 5'-phosphate oxidase family protein [Gammaproteobacteria bacterium]|nr:pyridoxamine 5'-phosphate oxidase family protein [Gammaproteobacteria bacterium]
MSEVSDDTALRGHYRPMSDRVQRKVLNRLDSHCKRIIELSPFCVLGTSNQDGQADVSPRGGAPGFVRCLDDNTLILPDASGNNRLDSLSNAVQNPEVGLLFMVPGLEETLRVNGRASVSADPELCASFDVGRRPAATVLKIEVREAFLHCAKAIMRADLWNPQTHIDRGTLPSISQMLKDQIGFDEPAQSQDEMGEYYRRSM